MQFMDQELLTRFEAQEKKIDAIYVSVEKTRKYFLWTFIVTIVTFVIPLIVIIIILPSFISTLTNAYSVGN